MMEILDYSQMNSYGIQIFISDYGKNILPENTKSIGLHILKAQKTVTRPPPPPPPQRKKQRVNDSFAKSFFSSK